MKLINSKMQKLLKISNLDNSNAHSHHFKTMSQLKLDAKKEKQLNEHHKRDPDKLQNLKR